MMPLITLRVEDAIVRRYYDKGKINIYIGNCIIIVATMTLLMSFAMFLTSHLLSQATQIPYFVYFFIPLYCFLSFIKTIFLYYLQVQQKATFYGFFSIVSTMLEFSLAIFFVVVLHMTWEGQALAMIIAVLFSAGFAYIALNKWDLICYQRDKESASHALHYGLWLVPEC